MRRFIALLFVSIIVLASVFVSGCTLPSSNPTAPSTEAAANKTVKTVVDKLHDILVENTTSIKAWKVTWVDANTVRIDAAADIYNVSENTTTHLNYNYTIERFNTVNDATNYLNAHNNDYKLDSTTPANDGAYVRATGHKASTFEYWVKTTTETSNYLNQSIIAQHDNLIFSLNLIATRYAGRLTQNYIVSNIKQNNVTFLKLLGTVK